MPLQLGLLTMNSFYYKKKFVSFQITMAQKFAGKVALITGASSGIGAATAILFSKLGANVSIIGRNMQNLQKTAENCFSGSPGQKKPLLIQGQSCIYCKTSKKRRGGYIFLTFFERR